VFFVFEVAGLQTISQKEMAVFNMQDNKKTFKHELVQEESPIELWDKDEKGESLRRNPYKTPPNNLTTKQKKYGF